MQAGKTGQLRYPENRACESRIGVNLTRWETGVSAVMQPAGLCLSVCATSAFGPILWSSARRGWTP